jgi:hypothetical protein
MDWAGLGLAAEAIAWLEDVPQHRYVRDARLDPFATSMRDFDDVAPNLKALRGGSLPAVSDPVQRLGDLRAAGLASEATANLSPLGIAVLDGWERLGVDNARKDDELSRLLIFVLEGRRTKSPEVEAFIAYWADIRSNFDPYATIENWDALYALNYMDFARAGFVPGRTFRDFGVPIEAIEFDIADFARSTGASESAVEGGARVERAIAGKVPRGRHRATFCMALEIEAGGAEAASVILRRFGTPRRPRSWKSFSDDQKLKINTIVATYALPLEPVTAAAPPATRDGSINNDGAIGQRTHDPLTLPNVIDFNQVLVPAPSAPPERGGGQGKGTGPRKRDYVQQARDDDEVGRLGEIFALQYERWRLRDHPELADRVRHVAETDDTLGYDIESFELNGEVRYIEVKTTTSTLDSRFFVSSNELDSAARLGSQYVILRVCQITTQPRCCEYRFPFTGKLILTASTYVAVPAPGASI